MRIDRRLVLTAGLIIGTQGCASSVPLVPPPPLAQPTALQIGPGLGCSLQSAGAVYLVVDAVDTKNRPVLSHLSEVIAGELRSATTAEVIVLVDAGLDCPPAVEWSDMCRVCHVPIDGAPASAVVVFCDLLEYDPYTPLRVSLSMRVRRVTDGGELVSLQGTWVGTPPVTPRLPPFHWIRKKGPPRPNIDFVWTAQFEEQSATELVRSAAHQCVAALQASGYQPRPAFPPTTLPPQVQDIVPPAPPALPEFAEPPEVDPPPTPELPPDLDIPPATEAGITAPASTGTGDPFLTQ